MSTPDRPVSTDPNPTSDDNRHALVRELQEAWELALAGEAPPSLEDYLAAVGVEDEELRQQLEAINESYQQSWSSSRHSHRTPRDPNLTVDEPPGETLKSEELLDPNATVDPEEVHPDDPFATVDPEEPHDPNATVDPDPFPVGELTTDAAPFDTTEETHPRKKKKPLPSVPGYEILEELGRGGMGVVYKARHIELDRLVALKMVLAGANATESQLERFYIEARAVARIQHPNIVQIYEIGTHEGLPYFSLEFVQGGSLDGKTKRTPQPPDESAQLVSTTARAMHVAHEREIIHRDLKPANILLNESGQPKITDFGLAKRVEEDTGATQEGTILGSPGYMPPEQASGDLQAVDSLSDVYSLGAVLYEMLTGRPPFQGTSILEVLEQVRKKEPVPPTQLQPTIPIDLETICLKALQKEKSKRYESAASLADDLDRYLRGEPIYARPVSSAERLWRWCKRNPRLAWLTASVAILLLLVAGISTGAAFLLAKETRAKEEERKRAVVARNAADDARKREEKAHVETKKMSQVAIAQNRSALDALRGLLLHVNDQLRRRPGLRDLQKRVTEIVNREMVKMPKLPEHKELYNRSVAIVHVRQGEIHDLTGNPKKALGAFEQSRKILASLEQEDNKNPVAKRNLAAITNKIGDLYKRLGNVPQARECYSIALELRKKWKEMLKGKSISPTLSVAQSYSLLTDISLDLGDLNSAEKYIKLAEKEYLTLPKQIHNRYQIQEGFAARERIMGNLALRQGKVEQAQAHLVASLDRRTRLTKRSSDPAAKIQLAESHVELGDFYFLQRADFLSAMKHYTEAESIHSELAKADPKHLPTQRHLSLVWYRLGTVYLHRSWTGSASIAGFWRIASRHWYLKCLGARKRLSQMDKTDVRAKYELAIIQARCGDHPSAVAFADGVLPSIKKDPSTLFQVACIYSLASGVGKMSSNHYKSQAFQVLDQMSQLGWKDPVTLKSDPDLIYLQSDSRFDKLLRMLSGEKN